MSFMLAALRVLHIDTSHPPAKLAAYRGNGSLKTYQLRTARRVTHAAVKSGTAPGSRRPQRTEAGEGAGVGFERAIDRRLRAVVAPPFTR